MTDNLDFMDQEQTSQSSTTTVPTTKQSLAVPVAIVLGFGLIAAAIFFSGQSSPAPLGATDAPQDDAAAQVATGGDIRPVDDTDHVRGNPNAPIMIVEYSDFDCPFCKNFHETMNQVMDNYGTTGQVAWVYRQFPLEQLHPSAPYIANASECVAALGGNDAFWKFADLIFGERGTNEPTNVAKLPDFATQAGVDAAAFTACAEAGTYQADVDADYNDAVAAGGRGTPYSIVSVAGQQGVINGAQPYDVVNQIIKNLLTQVEGGNVE